MRESFVGQLDSFDLAEVGALSVTIEMRQRMQINLVYNFSESSFTKIVLRRMLMAIEGNYKFLFNCSLPRFM